jgi:predicted RND superfamily exporter protein
LVNVPILPAILGIGVDNGVYLAVAIARRGETPEGLRLAVDATGRAILAATATTACGFASFLVADSGSLRSIGLLALIGVLIAAFASLAVLPTLGELRARRRRDVEEAGDDVPVSRPGEVPVTGPYPIVE